MRLVVMTLGVASLVPAAAPAQQAESPRYRFERLAKKAATAREQNRAEEAIALYRQALKMKPSWDEGWWYLGTLLYDRDRFAEGRDAFRRVVALKADGGPGWAMLGLCEFKVREYDGALKHIQRGLELGLGENQQLSLVTRFHAGLLLTRFEMYDEALEILRGLVKEGNESPSIVEAFGLALLRLPFLPAEAPPDRRDLVVRAGRAGVLTVGNRRAEARKEFEELIARYPAAPNVHYAFGVLLLLDNEADRALGEWRREIEIAPANLLARLQIAREYLRRGEPASGLKFAEEGVNLAPNSFAFHSALGRILLGMGEIERAVRELETAVQLGPEAPEPRFALSSAYARAGRKEDAARERKEFQRLEQMQKNR